MEEITARTHNFKSFPVFVRMLLTALRRESDSVFVDLLTYGDLELLKSKRAGGAGAAGAAQPPGGDGGSGGTVPFAAAAAASPQQPPNTKRYLILTYAAEFDRVHYPLPLARHDPDPQRLQAIIRQLRAQLGGSGGGQQRRSGGGLQGPARRPAEGGAAPGEVRALREENSALKQQLCSLETRLACGQGSDVQRLTADAQETVNDLRQVSRSGWALLGWPHSWGTGLRAAESCVPVHPPSCSQMWVVPLPTAAPSLSPPQMRKERDALMLRAQQAEAALEGERNLHRRELRRKLKEQQELAAELGAAKEQIRELRLKCRELTQELDLTQRRAKVANLRCVQCSAGRAGSGSHAPFCCRPCVPAAS